ncbi:alcohol dehydrogenase catalytic domain-containing protein, partial [Pseudomonas aeruginosa]
AILCHAFGSASSLVLEEIASPSEAKNEILLNLLAAGAHSTNTLIIEGKYPFKPPFPFSPCGGAAGLVAAVVAKVAHVRAGARVMAMTGCSSFAEQVKAPGYHVMPITEGMDFASA